MIRRRDDRGFVLVTTLWFLALLALASVLIEGWISGALDRATRLRNRSAANVAILDASDRVGFMLASGSGSPRGLELIPVPVRLASEGHTLPPAGPHIALDGRSYRLAAVTLQLQDESGLVDLTRFGRDAFEQLLMSRGVSKAQAAALIMALRDHLKWPADRTASAGADPGNAVPAPITERRAALMTPWALTRIDGWGTAAALWRPDDPLSDLVTIGPTSGINVNTAPAAVLAAVAGIDRRAAERLIAQRATRPFADFRDLQHVLRPQADRPLQLTPSGIVRLTLTVDGAPLAHIISLRTTPRGTAPYRIDYAVDLPRPADDPRSSPLPLPEIPPPGAR